MHEGSLDPRLPPESQGTRYGFHLLASISLRTGSLLDLSPQPAMSVHDISYLQSRTGQIPRVTKVILRDYNSALLKCGPKTIAQIVNANANRDGP